MQKNISTIIVILIAAIMIGSLMIYLPADPPTSDQAAQTFEKYVNEEKRYSIEYPKDWQKQEMPRLDLLLFSPSKEDPSKNHTTMNIVSENVGDTVSLDQFYSESVKHLALELKEVHVDKTGENVINYLPTKWISYTHVMMQTKFQVLQYFFVAKGNIYLLTFSAPATEFDSYRNTFEKIASTFRIL